MTTRCSATPPRTRSRRSRSGIGSLRSLLRDAGRGRVLEDAYFFDNCRRMQFAVILRMRCGARMPRASARRSSASFGRTLAARARGLRAARRSGEQIGRPVTLGAELGLPLAFAWRHLVAASARGRKLPRRRLRIDAHPARPVPKPGKDGPSSRPWRDRRQDRAARAGRQRRRAAAGQHADPHDRPGPLLRGLHRQVQPRPRLAAHGARVRIVTVDPVGPLPSSWQRSVEAYSGLDGLFEQVEVVFGRESTGIEVVAPIASWRPPGGPPTSPTTPCARPEGSASST